VQEYLDSPLADDKDDAANLRTAIARATTKRRSKPYDRTAEKANISDKFASRGGAEFNARNFFVALASSTETAVEDNNSSLENVSTVMNKDATLDSAPLKEPQQQRHSEPPKNKHQRHGDDHLISTKTTVNEVEYNVDIDINYEVKSDKTLVNVKGSLKNHCQFWENVLNASIIF
jgi:hypothetical protein